MALPVLTQHLVETKLTAYCEHKIPLHVRDQVKISFNVRGNYVTLNEERQTFIKPGTWVTIPIAQFRFDDDAGVWTLYCVDRNSKWHRYTQTKSSRNIADLLLAIDADRTGIFWG